MFKNLTKLRSYESITFFLTKLIDYLNLRTQNYIQNINENDLLKLNRNS